MEHLLEPWHRFIAQGGGLERDENEFQRAGGCCISYSCSKGIISCSVLRRGHAHICEIQNNPKRIRQYS